MIIFKISAADWEYEKCHDDDVKPKRNKVVFSRDISKFDNVQSLIWKKDREKSSDKNRYYI